MLRQLASAQAVERLWARDASLWHPAATTQARIAERLGWLGLPDQSCERLTQGWLSSQPETVLFVATEATQSHARLWRDLLPTTQRRLLLLDTIDPAVVQPTLAALDWSRTALVLAATELTPEMSALAESTIAAWSRAGATAAGPLTLLSTLDSELTRRYASSPLTQLIAVPSDLGERFGAASALGLVPAALAGYDPEPLIDAAVTMRAACQQTADLQHNPGVLLGALLGVLAQQGRDKLTLLASAALTPLAEWIASFVAASLGKHGRGFVPIAGEPWAMPARYHPDRCFVALRLSQAADAGLDQQIAALREAGQPVVVITLAAHDELLAHQLCWQVAAAITASIIGVNPFDEPDTVAMRAYIQRRAADWQPLPSEPMLRQTSAALAGAAPEALALLRQASWAALVSYLPPTPQQVAELAALRRLLLRRAGLATVLVYPLRDHAYSVQLLHAGRPGGVVLGLLPPSSPAVAQIDDRLDRLSRTRMAVELGAWRQMGRPVVTLELDSDPIAGLRAWYAALDQLL